MKIPFDLLYNLYSYERFLQAIIIDGAKLHKYYFEELMRKHYEHKLLMRSL